MMLIALILGLRKELHTGNKLISQINHNFHTYMKESFFAGEITCFSSVYTAHIIITNKLIN